MAVFGRRELHINGVVVADEQPVTGRLEGLVVAEPGRVEDGRREQDDEHGDTRAARPDVATSVQRVTDGDVATESHVHSQPRTAQLERVDQTPAPASRVHRTARLSSSLNATSVLSFRNGVIDANQGSLL